MSTIAEFILELRDRASEGLKAIAGGARTVEQDAAQAEHGLAQLDDQVARTGDRTAGLGDKAGKAGSQLGKLAGAASMVSPELANTARAGADVADVFEVAQVAAGALGITLGSLLAAVGIAAAIVAPFALAWRDVANELERAEHKAELMSRRATELGTLTGALTEAERGLASALGGASAKEAEEAVIRERWAKQLSDSTATLRAHKAELEGEQAQLQRDGLNTNREARARVAAELKRVNAELETSTAIAEKGIQTDLDAADAADARAEAERVLAERQRKAAEATSERAKAEAELQAAWEASDSYAAFLYDTSDYLASGSAAVIAQARMAAAVLKEQEDRAKAAAAAMADWKASVDPDTLAAFNYDTGLGEAPGPTSAAPPTSTGSTGPSATDVLSGIGGGASGILNLVGSAGMVGSIVATVVSLLGSMSQTNEDGTNTFAAGITSFVNGIVAQLPALGKMVGDLVAGLLRDTVPALLGALGPTVEGIVREGLPAIFAVLLDPSFWLGLVQALIEALWAVWMAKLEGGIRALGEAWDALSSAAQSLFSTAFWKGIGESIVQAIKDALALLKGNEEGTGLFQKNGAIANGWNNVKNWFKEGFTGSYDVGSDYIHRSGWAMVHEGERIVTASGTGSQRTGQLAGGGTHVEIHAQGAFVDGRFAAQVAQELGRAGNTYGVTLG